MKRLACSLLLSSVCAAAQAADTFGTLYRDALAGNAGYLAAAANVAAESAGVDQARGQLLPALGLSASRSSNRADRITALSPLENFDYQSRSYSFNLRQPLWRPYSTALLRQAQQQEAGAQGRLGAARGELLLSLVTAGMQLLFTQDELQLYDAQALAVEAQLRAAQMALEAGEGTRPDIDAARVRRDIVRAQQLQTANHQQELRDLLGAMTARPVSSLAPLDPQRLELAPAQPNDLQAWITQAEQGNAELQALRADVGRAREEVNKAKAGHVPTLDLVASKSRASNDSVSTLSASGNVVYASTSVGVQFSVPLYAGGQVEAGVRQALARQEQAQQLYEDRHRRVLAQVATELRNIDQGGVKVRALEQAERSAAQAVVSARKGLTAGLRTRLEVLNAEQQLFEARRDLADGRYGWLLARLRLLVLAGRTAPEELAAFDAALTVQ